MDFCLGIVNSDLRRTSKIYNAPADEADDVALKCGDLCVERRRLRHGTRLGVPNPNGRFQPRSIGVLVCLDGALAVDQANRELRLGPGDFVALSWGSAVSVRTASDADSSILLIKGEYSAFALETPNIDIFLGIPFSNECGTASVFSSFCCALSKSLKDQYSEEVGLALGKCIIRTLCTFFYEQYQTVIAESPNITARRNAITQYIEKNLKNPDISVTHLANEFRISSRYIHTIFSKTGETVSKYVLRRRLEECRRDLSDSAVCDRTITQIAFEWGFSNTTYFSRVFREAFNETPGAFRRKAIAESSS